MLRPTCHFTGSAPAARPAMAHVTAHWRPGHSVTDAAEEREQAQFMSTLRSQPPPAIPVAQCHTRPLRLARLSDRPAGGSLEVAKLLLGPAYLDGTDLACYLKPTHFLYDYSLERPKKRPSGKRRGPTREVRQVLGLPFYAPHCAQYRYQNSRMQYAFHGRHMR